MRRRDVYTFVTNLIGIRESNHHNGVDFGDVVLEQPTSQVKWITNNHLTTNKLFSSPHITSGIYPYFITREKETKWREGHQKYCKKPDKNQEYPENCLFRIQPLSLIVFDVLTILYLVESTGQNISVCSLPIIKYLKPSSGCTFWFSYFTGLARGIQLITINDGIQPLVYPQSKPC